jgi:hypothetical protein
MTIGFLGNSFIGWYYIAYVLLLPALSIISLPLLLLGKYTEREKTWRKYLVTIGFIGVLGIFMPYLAVFDMFGRIERNVFLKGDLYFVIWNFCGFISVFGLAIQAGFFVVRLIYIRRKIELTDRYYKLWSGCFFLLYILPNVILLALVVDSYLKRH